MTLQTYRNVFMCYSNVDFYVTNAHSNADSMGECVSLNYHFYMVIDLLT